ncbi:MAG TPA: NAD(P)/FAD-dependent oxidoreductase [Kofleriaceae bacterium]|jgi:cation diffusion facilitator CzcD-associated flavoprotein CzcO|nr:NAD(P)/FAD-dependent oxidoreductase [Kofleriaceae bacterium]
MAPERDSQVGDDLDVIIVGAGLSGVGAAYRLQTECPTRRFTILEARDAIGGTWDLFRYPGIRSDSDMFTLGYPFYPWKAAKAIADGPSILAYIRDTAATFGIDRHIRFRHRIVAARWSSADARWTLDVEVGEQCTPKTLRCAFLYLCAGYYRYDAAHVPAIVGVERFAGKVIYPQWWPADLDYTGKRIVVIGSGATAVTLVPAMAGRAAHVTMLQRSPTYYVSRPERDPIADAVRKLLPAQIAHRVVRGKNVLLGTAFYQFCRRYPEAASRRLRSEVAKLLPPGYAVERHFTPRYHPWDQRLCLVPDADLFKAIADGKVTVVTDTIDAITETGVRVSSGETLPADILVMATGLQLVPWGGIQLTVDQRAIEPRDTLVYKGMMGGGLPNLAWCVGYTNASWTLRADLTSRNVCRLLNYMDRHHYDQFVPRADPAEVERRPLLGLSSGYIQRAADQMPMQGSKTPWYLRQNYILDFLSTKLGRVENPALLFSRRRPVAPQAAAPELQHGAAG